MMALNVSRTHLPRRPAGELGAGECVRALLQVVVREDTARQHEQPLSRELFDAGGVATEGLVRSVPRQPAAARGGALDGLLDVAPHCPGRKPPFLVAKRPERPYKSAIENRFT